MAGRTPVDLVSSAPALAPIVALIRAARERYDRTGYPDGLAREDIPLGARIVAACAALAAMITDRPYAHRRDTASALDELRRHAGTQFDPQIVDALHQVAVQSVAT
jgi:HD-GYP domain-containing protein (c-di-GMP phosphodiesterase class II)